MTTNIKAQERLREVINSGNFHLFKELVAPKAIDHDPAPGQALGPEGFQQFFTELHSAFPDLQVNIEQMVSDEDNIAIAYTMTGTQQGTFMGFAPTGKGVRIRGVQIGRFEDGKLIERWGSTDQLGILQQLGYAPSA
ncbi:ester cyclase [Ktedonospora formicarum]|uniref:Ester cyclase n=1 Tax=Ktedonospora formicarum TaxID=2778364 RepID=A0A8J3MR73_9CHLR|nr:ester cyclase [Ktedonospora formicarum]GHO45642.1 hypothetical protein KSX_38050 [Ktedonospora formicarum]